MKAIRKILTGLLVILIIIQFVQPARNKSSEAMPYDISHTLTIPGNVQGILKKACYDCHSNNTVYPWYSFVQPMHWVLNNHIQSGKEELNFNEFGSYSLRRQRNKLRAVENNITDESMPLFSYTLLHRNAILSDKEKSVLLRWLQVSTDSLNRRSNQSNH